MATKKTEKPSYRAGYYAGRGYHDAPPFFKAKEFNFLVTARVSRNPDSLLMKAAQADLVKKWPIKTAPFPSVDEVWMIDGVY